MDNLMKGLLMTEHYDMREGAQGNENAVIPGR